MRIDFVTLFPEMVLGGLRHSMLLRAEERGIVEFGAVSPRDFASDPRQTVDDKPAGGGPGMVLLPEPISAALASVKRPETVFVFTEPTGKRFTQGCASDLSKNQHLVFACGHYEGIDHRVIEEFASHVFSVGDYVLTGGELPAMLMADAIVRLLPGVLGDPESLQIDSHSDGLLSASQYARGPGAPEVLSSGNHQAIARWKRAQSLRLTRLNRPDLFCTARLEKTDLDLLYSELPVDQDCSTV